MYCDLFSETEDSCKVCCRNRDGLCTSFVTDEGKYLFLRKGKPCTVGFCDGAVSVLLVFVILESQILNRLYFSQ